MTDLICFRPASEAEIHLSLMAVSVDHITSAEAKNARQWAHVREDEALSKVRAFVTTYSRSCVRAMHQTTYGLSHPTQTDRQVKINHI